MIRMTRGASAVVFVVCVLPVAAGAQGIQGEEVLTNADVVKLTAAGLTAGGILKKIEASRTDFETSVAKLVELLEKYQVKPEVVAAMIAAGETHDGEQALVVEHTDREHQEIEFGDDDSVWARDNECDDPRFEGDGMARTLNEEDRGHDATDCRRLYRRGFIRLRSTP